MPVLPKKGHNCSASIIRLDDFILAFGTDSKTHRVYVVRWPISSFLNGDLMTPQWWTGTSDGWMKEPCRTCPEKTKDFGGCRCQAYMLTGDAANADPVCDKSPYHHVITEAVELAQQPQPSAAEVKPIILFRDDKNSRRLAEEGAKQTAPRSDKTPVT